MFLALRHITDALSQYGFGATPSIGDSDPEFTSGTSKTLQLPDQWKGFIWGRTKCSLNASNYFSCGTGDCGGNKICQWPIPNSPHKPLVVSYELNLNHGHNVPVRIQPVGGSGPCPAVDCAQDFSDVCPPNLVAKGEDGRYVGCLSSCDALKDPKHCCFGNLLVHRLASLMSTQVSSRKHVV
ncbi:thaumatin-like protein 1 [Quercus suber]|uniref:Thaumatin-like protein 1 n=1 Tax=Quercus suber TaxID=58331 RepID=A0AAW0JZ62_QUESU